MNACSPSRKIHLLKRACQALCLGAVAALSLGLGQKSADAQTGCSPVAGQNSTSCGSFVPFQDPWPSARERWWDISNTSEQQYDAFLGLDGSQPWSYANNAQVTVSYDTRPSSPYFVGNIKATGLKPNFAYQMKLLGKPVKGGRGFGANGDDVGNERLGYAGRWWCDTSHSSQTNFDDSHYVNFYKNAPSNGNPVHDIYGYQYMGAFVTDSLGRANINFTGKNSYHITWPDWQVGTGHTMPEDPRSPFVVQGGVIDSNPTRYYGYGSIAPTASVRLFYEYEGSGRPRDNVVLPTGAYKARIVLTEESFHNSATLGGFWKSVLIANDINFTIGAAGAPTNLTATAGNGSVALSWGAASGATSYTIKRSSGGAAYTNLPAVITGTSYTDTSVVNGTTYSYIVVAVNGAGEGGSSNAVTATPTDGSKPGVTLTVPATATLSSLDAVTATATGGVGPLNVVFTIQRLSDGKYWDDSSFVPQRVQLQGAKTGTNTYSRTDMPGNAEARYAIYAYVYDSRNYSSSDRKFVNVNLAPPTVQITSHTNNQVVNRLDSVLVHAVDNVGGSGINPGQVLLYIQRGSDGKWWNGTDWVGFSTGLPMSPAGTNTYARSSTMPGDLGETGRYLIMVYAYDHSGQAGRSVVTVGTPLAPPTVTITAPANASTLRVNRLDAVTGTAQDNAGGSGLNRVVFFLQRSSDGRWWDGNSWETAATTLTTNLTTGNGWTSSSPLPSTATTLPNGRYLVAAYAYDNARQVNRAISVFTVSAP